MIMRCILKCIVNNVKPPQNFEFPETELSLGLFGLKSFYGFVSLTQLEDVTDCLSSILLFIIVLFFMASIKTFKKHQYAPTRTQKIVK